MADIKGKRCDLCGKTDVYTPGGVVKVTVTRKIHSVTEDTDTADQSSSKAKTIDLCDSCLKRSDKFTFDRGLTKPPERKTKAA